MVLMKWRFNIQGDEYTLNVVKGTAKPMDESIWACSMQSGQNCICRKLNMCPIWEDCYVNEYEENGMMGDNTIKCRDEDEKTIDKLVSMGMEGVYLFTDELLRRNKLARKHKCLNFRFNISGDLKTIYHLAFVDNVAKILYEKEGIKTTIYTHREDLIYNYKLKRLNHDGLIINGSQFWADNIFDLVRKDAPQLCMLNVFNYKPGQDECSSNCVKCKKEDKYWCYTQRGRNIGEKFRIKGLKEPRIREIILKHLKG